MQVNETFVKNEQKSSKRVKSDLSQKEKGGKGSILEANEKKSSDPWRNSK